MDLLKVIHERRSVRKYRKEAVPEEILAEILDAARHSPSWSNTQTWRFIVVKNEETKEKLQGVLTSNNPARATFVEAPMLICLVSQRGVSGFRRGEPATDKGDWFMFDAGIAMEHLVLAAWSFGLGTCHVGAFDGARVEEILDVPPGYSAVEITPLGYFDDMPPARPRKSLKEIVFADHFGEPYIP
jgi:nitroreductase